MAENGKNIDDLFRENLDDYSEVPRASVWSDVEQKLDGNDRNTGGVAGMGPGAKILLFLVAGVALFFTAKWALGGFNRHKTDKPGIVITNEAKPSSAKSHITVDTSVNTGITAAAPTQPASQAAETPAAEAADNDNTRSGSASHGKSIGSGKLAANPGATITNSGSLPVKKEENIKEATGSSANPGTTVQPASGNTLATVVAGNSVAGKPAVQHNVKITDNLQPPVQQIPADNTKAQQPVIPDPSVNISKEVIRDKSDILPIDPNAAFVMLAAKPDGPALTQYNPDMQRLLKRLRRSLTQAGIEGGIKLGFEAGFSFSAEKIAISPYLKYDISPALSLILQPGIKYVHLNKTEITPAQPFYDITNSAVTTGHSITKGDSVTAAPDTITRRYYYKQTQDSIRIGFNTAKRNYFEFELPILLQAKLTSKLSVFGGITFNFDKVVAVVENKQQYTNITRTDSVIYKPVPVTSVAPVPPSMDSLFKHNTPAYGNYTGNANLNPSSDPMKLGYMLGFSYKIKDKWSVDLMMQQMLSSAAYIPDDKVRSLYKQPYFRVSVGYRLFKNKR